jgi:Acetyltransferase (GNAT) domain
MSAHAAPPMALEHLVFNHPDEFPADVVALFDATAAQGTATGTAWFRHYVDALCPNDPALRFHVVRRDGAAIAALALRAMAADWTRHARLESLGNYYTTLYAPALADTAARDDVVALLDAIIDSHRPLASLRLQPMDHESRGYRLLLEAARRRGLVPFEFYCHVNWFLRGHVDWPTYLTQRTAKMRSNIKRAQKKFEHDGGSVEVITAAADMPRGMQAYQQVYQSSWKQAEPHPEFITGLAEAFAYQGWTRVGVAWLQGRPIAAQLWFVANGRAEIYKVAYDEAYKDYSPGTVLMARLAQDAMQDDRVHEVDFLVGDDEYKRIWMSERRERRGIVAYNPRTLAGATGALLEALKRRVKRWRDALRRSGTT